MSVAVVTDSNSGILPSEAKENGIFVIPMPFMIDEVEYFEDISLSREEFYKFLENNVSVVTSQPSPEAVMEMWDSVLKDYDELVYIPMSSGLSGSCQTAYMLSDDYDGRVHVINNQRISVTLRDSVFDAVSLSEKGLSGAEIKEKLEEVKFESTIYIMVGTLEYLKRGGRVTPAVATIGNLLKLKPVLAIHGEKLDAHATVRTISQGKASLLNSVKSDLEKLLKDPDPSHYHFNVAYSKDSTNAIEFAEEVKEFFGVDEVFIAALPLSISCHIGPESLAIAISKKL